MSVNFLERHKMTIMNIYFFKSVQAINGQTQTEKHKIKLISGLSIKSVPVKIYSLLKQI